MTLYNAFSDKVYICMCVYSRRKKTMTQIWDIKTEQNEEIKLADYILAPK
jgi:hypothetical protein